MSAEDTVTMTIPKKWAEMIRDAVLIVDIEVNDSKAGQWFPEWKEMGYLPVLKQEMPKISSYLMQITGCKNG